LTGLLPSSHGVTDFAVPLAAVHPTWAELLKKKGYHTAAFIGAVILDSKSLAPGLDRGFDFYDNFPEHPLTKSRFGRVERRGKGDTKIRRSLWLAIMAKASVSITKIPMESSSTIPLRMCR